MHEKKGTNEFIVYFYLYRFRSMHYLWVPYLVALATIKGPLCQAVTIEDVEAAKTAILQTTEEDGARIGGYVSRLCWCRWL